MDIDVYDYMVWGDYNKVISDLADKALSEPWSFDGKSDNSILKNYLKYTFYKLQEENKVLETNDYCVFNTGLFTTYYEQIYVLGEKNNNPDIKWKFKQFCTTYDLGYLEIHTPPERADYFKDPGLLVFDWRCKVNINYKHILEDPDNKRRLPDCVLQADKPDWILKSSIDETIQKVTANYKLAVPQYFGKKIQLLLPLCFDKSEEVHLALALTKTNGMSYLAHTCLTMEMAYNNARLISKPESNWLLPQ